MGDLIRLIKCVKIWLMMVLIMLIQIIVLIAVSAATFNRSYSLLIALSVPLIIISIINFILYVMILATCYSGDIHDILMIIGFFIPILGLAGLIIKYVWAKNKYSEYIYRRSI